MRLPGSDSAEKLQLPFGPGNKQITNKIIGRLGLKGGALDIQTMFTPPVVKPPKPIPEAPDPETPGEAEARKKFLARKDAERRARLLDDDSTPQPTRLG